MQEVYLTRPLVSIIVPCYNQAAFLPETLDSVQRQSYISWECIIVDDGSVDNTKQVVHHYTSQDSRFRYYQQPNSGVSTARNVAVEYSLGEYILPLDGDDKFHPKYVEECVRVFQSDASLKLVYCKAAFFGKKEGLWNLPRFVIQEQLLNNCIFCSAMFKKSDFIRIGGYKTVFKYGYEDWDLWIRLITRNEEVYRLDEVYFYYRIGDNSRNTKLDRGYMLKQMKEMIYWENIETYRAFFGDPIAAFGSNKVLKEKLAKYENSRLHRILARMIDFFQS